LLNKFISEINCDGLLSLLILNPVEQEPFGFGKIILVGPLSFAVRCTLKQNEKKDLLACEELEVGNKLPSKSSPTVPTMKYKRFIPLVFRENLEIGST